MGINATDERPLTGPQEPATESVPKVRRKRRTKRQIARDAAKAAQGAVATDGWETNPYGMQVALGAYWKLICRAGSPQVPVQLLDQDGVSWFAWADFAKQQVCVQRKAKVMSDNPKVSVERIPKAKFKFIRVG